MVNYPWYAWLLVLIGVVGLPALTAVGLYRVGLRAGAVVFALVWSVWIVTSALLAEGGAYRQLPDASRPWIGVAAGGAVAALMAAAGIPAVRGAFANPGNLAALTWPQSLRVVGAVFLIAMALGGLPAAFALPAGLGDVAVGIGAVFVARRLTRGDRSGASWFNVLGLFDLVLAVSLGFLAGLGPSQVLLVSPSTADIGLLPLALIPTTAVPLAVALHLTSLARLRRPSVRPDPAVPRC